MNFQSVKASPGKYIKLQAVITEINHFPGEQFGPYALGKARDNQGQVEKCFFTIKKDSEFPTGLCAGHACNWAGRYDANKPDNGIKMYFDTMAQRDVAAQAPVQAPPQAPPADEPYHVPVGAPQSPPQQPQAPMASQGGVDPTRNSIESQTALKAATDLAVGRADLVPDMAKFYDIVGANKTWLQTGTVPPNVISSPMPTGPANFGGEQAPTDPNQDDSDMPEALRGPGRPV